MNWTFPSLSVNWVLFTDPSNEQTSSKTSCTAKFDSDANANVASCDIQLEKDITYYIHATEANGQTFATDSSRYTLQFGG
jgi:hypothetical protein